MASENTHPDGEETPRTISVVDQTLLLIHSDDPSSPIHAAPEFRRHFSSAVPPLVLKTCKNKSSKTAENCTALLESLVGFDEGRTALPSEDGGVLAVVEVLASGSLPSREHTVDV
ncbi:unnamed protein product [Camellia sinensis]